MGYACAREEKRRDKIMIRVGLAVAVLTVVAAAQPVRIDPPALVESGMPYLTTAPDGALYLSWIDMENGGHSLRFAKWEGAKWSRPETIAAGKNWFVNWADFPSLAVLPDGTMLAHWLTRGTGGGKFGYGIRVARRAGGTWREVHGMSLDEKEDYAGFLSFAGTGAVYLSPPSGAAPAAHSGHDDHGHRKTLRFLQLRPDGGVASDAEIDADVCSCCQTAMARTAKGLIAAYRDHREGEIRDISVVRFIDGAWTKPRTLHADGWKINGCPTEGPSIATGAEDRLAIAWLTRANAEPKVQMALSANGGAVFTAPLRVDGGNPLGRPSVARLNGSSYLVAWLEKTQGTRAEIRLRRVTAEGVAGPAIAVADVAASRTTGFPKVAVAGDQIVLAWRDERVRAAVLPIHTFLKKETK